ncbi:hypothetical protein SAMN05518872_105119 [Psychrobacillus sp. OK032]|nr:hypothetical protein SAMN05518872_105119 [Psychrobacillus sp. OK032]
MLELLLFIILLVEFNGFSKNWILCPVTTFYLTLMYLLIATP